MTDATEKLSILQDSSLGSAGEDMRAESNLHA